MKGYSGAKIDTHDKSVLKHGPTNLGLLDQARYCELLGSVVTPKILTMLDSESEGTEGYVMERLEEPLVDSKSDITEWAALMLCDMRRLLQRHVWTKNPLPSADFIQPLCEFLHGTEFYTQGRDFVDRLFIARPIDPQTCSLIHGDPTLANLMYRPTRGTHALAHIVICDPIRPVGKIPYHFTVDIGKMLQSAIGWEHQIIGWRYKDRTLVDCLLVSLSNLDKARSWFWCFIHLLRIRPYVPKQSALYEWATKEAWKIITGLEGACLHSISMARS